MQRGFRRVTLSLPFVDRRWRERFREKRRFTWSRSIADSRRRRTRRWWDQKWSNQRKWNIREGNITTIDWERIERGELWHFLLDFLGSMGTLFLISSGKQKCDFTRYASDKLRMLRATLVLSYDAHIRVPDDDCGISNDYFGGLLSNRTSAKGSVLIGIGLLVLNGRGICWRTATACLTNARHLHRYFHANAFRSW